MSRQCSSLITQAISDQMLNGKLLDCTELVGCQRPAYNFEMSTSWPSIKPAPLWTPEGRRAWLFFFFFCAHTYPGCFHTGLLPSKTSSYSSRWLYVKSSLFIFTQYLPHCSHLVCWDQNNWITLLVPRVKTYTGVRAIQLFPLFLWNNVLLSVCAATATVFIRQLLKTLLFDWAFPYIQQHSRWPVVVIKLLYRWCRWTLILLSRHWAWQRQGYRCYINWLIDWLIVWCSVAQSLSFWLLFLVYLDNDTQTFLVEVRSDRIGICSIKEADWNTR